MTGDVLIHDPSVIEIDGQFVALGAGQQEHGAIRVKTSPSGIHWTEAGLIGQGRRLGSSDARFPPAQRLGALD